MKRVIISLITILTLSIITIAIIAYGRGFRFNPQDGEVAATGLLNATSDPNGAQVYVDGTLKTATNSTLNLLPGTYQVKINKEGYLPWEKQMTIFKEVVAQTETFLFPANPGLSPLTTSGVENPIVSPDGASIAFTRRAPEATPTSSLQSTTSTSGIFVLDLADRPLSFSRKPRKIASFADLEPRASSLEPRLLWSPDAKELLAIFKNEEDAKSPPLAYLLDVSRLNLQPQPITSPAETLKLWQEQRELETQSKIASLPNKLIPLFTNETPAETTPGVNESQSPSVKRAAELISFSPDESKILYQATQETTIPQIIKPPLNGVNPTQEQRTIEPNNIYIYDLKEDRNYLLPQMVDSRQSTIDTPSSLESRASNAAPAAQLKWFPTSRHLFYIDNGKIKVMEYDGTNEITVYAGPFEKDFLVPWPNGSNLVILTTLNPDASETVNLYAVKLR